MRTRKHRRERCIKERMRKKDSSHFTLQWFLVVLNLGRYDLQTKHLPNFENEGKKRAICRRVLVKQWEREREKMRKEREKNEKREDEGDDKVLLINWQQIKWRRLRIEHVYHFFHPSLAFLFALFIFLLLMKMRIYFAYFHHSFFFWWKNAIYQLIPCFVTHKCTHANEWKRKCQRTSEWWK